MYTHIHTYMYKWYVHTHTQYTHKHTHRYVSTSGIFETPPHTSRFVFLYHTHTIHTQYTRNIHTYVSIYQSNLWSCETPPHTSWFFCAPPVKCSQKSGLYNLSYAQPLQSWLLWISYAAERCVCRLFNNDFWRFYVRCHISHTCTLKACGPPLWYVQVCEMIWNPHVSNMESWRLLQTCVHLHNMLIESMTHTSRIYPMSHVSDLSCGASCASNMHPPP